jgi:hypothetical protein
MIADGRRALPAVLVGLGVEMLTLLLAVVLRLNTKDGEVDRPWLRLIFLPAFFVGTFAARDASAGRGVGFVIAALGGLVAGMAWNSPKLRDEDLCDDIA